MTDTGPEAHWHAALAEGRLLLQRVPGEAPFFPPRVMAPGSGDAGLEWFEAGGGGTVYSVTVVSPRPPLAPYNVVLVDLDDGPRLMTRVDGIAPGDVRIGMRVRARIVTEDDAALLVFEPG